MNRITLTTQPTKDYELLDSGGEEKLERFGDVLLARPDPQALWEKSLGKEEWQKANGRYEREGREGKWIENKLPKEWEIEFGDLNFTIKPTSFKHTGLFPEQSSNWEWMGECLRRSNPSGHRESSAEDSLSLAPSRVDRGLTALQGSSASAPSVLNLFGYTGGATLAAAKAGAKVTHVDASKTAVAWARENAEHSGLGDAPVRWIIEDVVKFVKRELNRGAKYDAIVMDPPAFGHGPKDELWKIEENFVDLVKMCQQLLSDTPIFFLINGYAAGYSPLAFAYNLEPLAKQFGGNIEYGDITIAQKDGRLLPAGIFARWSK